MLGKHVKIKYLCVIIVQPISILNSVGCVAKKENYPKIKTTKIKDDYKFDEDPKSVNDPKTKMTPKVKMTQNTKMTPK